MVKKKCKSPSSTIYWVSVYAHLQHTEALVATQCICESAKNWHMMCVDYYHVGEPLNNTQSQRPVWLFALTNKQQRVLWSLRVPQWLGTVSCEVHSYEEMCHTAAIHSQDQWQVNAMWLAACDCPLMHCTHTHTHTHTQSPADFISDWSRGILGKPAMSADVIAWTVCQYDWVFCVPHGEWWGIREK